MPDRFPKRHGEGPGHSHGRTAAEGPSVVTTAAPKNEVDLFVIGAGSGGVRAARIAAGYGAKVMIAEEYRVGGTCVIRGCIPKKLFVYASRFSHDFDDAAGFGWTVPPAGFDWPTLIANKDKEIARLEGVYRANLEKAGVEIVETRAVIEDEHTVRLLASDAPVRCGHILIATGGKPFTGYPIPGIEHAISSNEAFHLPKLPADIVIHGGGYIAVEFACIFAGLGSRVTLVHRGENILRGFDDDVRTHVRTEMQARGIKVVLGELISRIDRNGGRYAATLTGGRRIEAERVMFAIGRTPNIAGLGIERVGVKTGPLGGVEVDSYARTSSPSIYAVGDVTNRINLTPVAIREGHAFADTVFGGRPTAVDHTNVPTAVFSEPEVGVVGLTEADAREKLARVDIYKSSFRPLKATLSGSHTRTLLKLVVDGTTGKVRGAHIVGEAAGEMIQILAIAIRMGAAKADLDATMALHPTAAEELVTMREPTARYGYQGPG
ncbi:MAG: glutathione-disulfide reductase [Bradyrhizobiaceae bacterium]|nr:glutathione-disulfide reductase [Bradyrhizobiaceae bacterium]